MDATDPLLRMNDIVKVFPGVRAVDGVSFEVARGEIHALLGHNGAGKTTLVKIIAGAASRDAGEMHFDGISVDFASPRMAIDAGVHMVYQELDLIPHLSGAENIYLGQARFHGRFGLIDHRAKLQAARTLIRSLGVDIDLRQPAGRLGLPKQQLIAVAKAISSNAKLIIFDEPTSALNATESVKLFDIMRLLAASGISLILITHRLDDVFGIADRVTVMRDGKRIFVRGILDVTKDDIVKNMTTSTDTRLAARGARPASSNGSPALACESISAAGKFDDISFTVGKGEVVGMIGLIGSGAVDVARSIFGADRLESGRVLVDGVTLTPGRTDAAVHAGLAFVSDDRKRDGLVLSGSVKHNISLSILGMISRLGVVNRFAEDLRVAGIVRRLNIRVKALDQLVTTLSGGNQQKVVLSKWLLRDSKVLILCEPTRGIDVATQGELHAMIVSFAAAGLGVLVVSSEIAEIFETCDRVIVLEKGRAIGEIQRSHFNKDLVMSMMYGTA